MYRPHRPIILDVEDWQSSRVPGRQFTSWKILRRDRSKISWTITWDTVACRAEEPLSSRTCDPVSVLPLRLENVVIMKNFGRKDRYVQVFHFLFIKEQLDRTSSHFDQSTIICWSYAVNSYHHIFYLKALADVVMIMIL